MAFQFQFEISEKFLTHAMITIPADFNESVQTYSGRTLEIEVIWFDGRVVQGRFARGHRPGVRGGTTLYLYYQIRLSHSATSLLRDELVIGQSITVEVRPEEQFRVFLYRASKAPIALDYETPTAFDLESPDPARVQCTTYRILRDTKLALQVKKECNYRCQRCGLTLMLDDTTPYAESHHVKPLGGEHAGPDQRDNVVCVCPNCHVLLDTASERMDKNTFPGVCEEYIEYHNRLFESRLRGID